MSTATDEQVDALRRVVADGWGIRDVPTYDPTRRYAMAPEYDIAARSPLTRRQMLDQLPSEARARREEELAAYGIDADLDSPEIIRCTIYGYKEQRGASPRWDLEAWLRLSVEQHIPDGYIPIGRWADVAPIAAVRAAKIAADEAPTRLQEAVRRALEVGVPAAKLAEELGLSRARVYQLRDGTR